MPNPTQIDQIAYVLSGGDDDLERSANRDKYRIILLSYNIWSAVLGFIVLVSDKPFITNIFGSVYPILGIVLIGMSSGLRNIRFFVKPDLYSTIIVGFAICALSVTASIFKYYIISYKNIGLPIALGFAFALVVLLIAAILRRSKLLAIEILIITFGAWLCAFGNLMISNFSLDHSVPVVYTSMVTQKFISRGKNSASYIIIKPWHTNMAPQKLLVSEMDHVGITVGDPASIKERKGFFHIPWFVWAVNVTPPVPADSSNGNYPTPK